MGCARSFAAVDHMDGGEAGMIAGGKAAEGWPRPNAREGDSKKPPRVYPGQHILLQVVELMPGGLVPLNNLTILGELALQGLQFGPLRLH